MATFRLLPLMLFLICHSMATAANEPELVNPRHLRFKPFQGTERQSVQKVDRIVTHQWDGDRQESTVAVTRSFLRTSQPIDGGRFSILSRVEEDSITLNGKPAPRLPGPQEIRFIVSEHGEVIPSLDGPSETISPNIRLVLPEKPVSPGDRWTHTIPATEGFPAPLELRFRYSGVSTYRNIPCVVIDSRASFDGAFPELGCRASVRITNRSYFDPEAGRLVGVVSSSRFILTYLRPYPERPRQSTTETRLRVSTSLIDD